MDFLGAARDECDVYRNPGYVQLFVSSILVIGILFSYLPQHYRIISRGTSEGISPYFVLLGTTSATAGFGNILSAQESRTAMGCCKELDGYQCTAALLGVAQFGTQWVCFSLILVLFLIFFRYKEATVPQEELRGQAPGWRTAITVGLVCVVHGLFVIILTGYFFLARPRNLNSWANFLGIMSTALASIQYLPQIYTTYRLKHVGSLSIPMMCIQTPGGLLFAFNLYVRLGWGGWSTWMIFLFTAAMQGVVLFMGIYYEVTRRSPPENEGGITWVDNAPSVPGSPDEQHHPRRRPQPNRTYSEGLERGLPGPFTGHPELYADNEDELEQLHEREQRAILRESQPLLKPGGIGHPRRDYIG